MSRYILLFIILATNVYANEVAITGKLLDSTSKTPLISANVRLVSADSSIKLLKETNKKGEFEFQNISKGQYTINVTYIGYTSYSKLITVSNNDINIGNIKLAQTAIQLDEVVVTANKTLIEQKGDTLDFNNNTKTKPDATLEDLLKKLPGFEVDKDGNIKYNGETIKSILLDGKPFFIDDPKVALENLPAKLIEKIKVYGKADDKDEFMKKVDAQKDKVLNIITKDKAKNGQFGKIGGGFSYSDKYKLSSSYNAFDSTARLTLAGNSTNFSPSSNSQYHNHKITGNYSDSLFSKIDYNCGFRVNYQSNINGSSSSREYLQENTSAKYYNYVQNNKSQNVSMSYNHKIEYALDTNNKFMLYSNFYHNVSNSQNNSISDNYTILNSLLNSSDLSNNTHNNEYSFYNALFYKHNFSRTGNSLAYNFTFNYHNSDNITNKQTESSYYDTISSTFTNIKQDNNNKANTFVIFSYLSYVMPINEKSNLQCFYTVSYQKNKNNNNVFTFDTLSKDYKFDSILSNIFDNYELLQKIVIGYDSKFNEDKTTIEATISFSKDEINNKIFLPTNDSYNSQYYYIHSYFYISNNFTKLNNISLRYASYKSLPEISQLEDRLNTDNPMSFTKGNPDLKQPYIHNITLNSTITLKENYVLSNNLSYKYTFNSIINSVNIAQADSLILANQILPAGGQISCPININGAWNTNLSSNLAFPIEDLFAKANIGINGSYSVSPRMLNNYLNKSKNYSLSPRFSITSIIDSILEITFSTKANYSIMENSYSNNTQTINNGYNNSLIIHWTVWKGAFVELSYDNQINTGSINNNSNLMNFNLGSKLFEKNKGEIKFSINDLLNKNKALENNITDYYVETIHKNIIKRYFLLEFSYQIGNMI